MPGPVSLTLKYCPPEAVQPTLIQMSPPCGVNLIALDSRLSAIWRIARSSAQTRGRSGLEHLVDGDQPVLGAQLHQMMAILHHVDERDRFLVQFVAAGLDARQIEDFVDQAEQMLAGIVDVVGIVLVGRHRMRSENLVLHHFGEAENGVERRAQFVAHLREEARLGDVGGLGAVARFVGNGLGLFQFADQHVLFGARLQRLQRR